MRTLKIFNTIILFFVTFIVIGQEVQVYKQTDNELMKYMLQNKMQINLTQGIDVDAILQKKPFIYNNFVFTTANASYYHPQISSDNNFIAGNFENYYQLDFAADPFDGRIQVMVMGEPLPTPFTTLICSLGVIGILLYCKKKKQVTA